MVATPDPTGVIEKMCIEDSRLFSDWTIVSEEGQRFPCHRVILAAKSSTMKAMMTTEMREEEQEQSKVHYNSRVVRAFVDYFYLGEVTQERFKKVVQFFLLARKHKDFLGF